MSVLLGPERGLALASWGCVNRLLLCADMGAVRCWLPMLCVRLHTGCAVCGLMACATSTGAERQMHGRVA